jgi:transaldolase
MPEQTLLDFANHGEIGELLPPDGGNASATLYGFEQAGVDVRALANQLQSEGADSFVQSWNDLMACLETMSQKLRVSAS